MLDRQPQCRGSKLNLIPTVQIEGVQVPFFIGGVLLIGIAKDENQGKINFFFALLKLPSHNFAGCLKYRLYSLFRYFQLMRIYDRDLGQNGAADEEKQAFDRNSK